MRVAVLALLLLVVSATTGCGAEKKLSTTPIEQGIQRGLQRQTRIKIGSVDCPSKVKPKQGATFNCTATYAGGRAKIRVRQKDERGNVTWHLTGRPATP